MFDIMETVGISFDEVIHFKVPEDPAGRVPLVSIAGLFIL
jgi:hypothetical protein